MTTITFAEAVNDPSLLADFDPASDILLFTEHAAAEVKLSGTDSGVTLAVGADSVSLSVALKSLVAGTNSFIRFIDGSTLFIGDGTAATVADDLSNQMNTGPSLGDDLVMGLGGDDRLYIAAGDDRVYGNAGDDSISSAEGVGFPQQVNGYHFHAGHDTLFGGQGNDSIYYYNSEDALLAYGNLGADYIYGADGSNVLYGGQGDDTLYGGEVDDVMYGNADNDLIYDYDGDNTIFGGQGNDTIYFGGGNYGENIVYGNLGDDSIETADKGDTVFAGQGNDTIYVEHGGNHDVRGNAGNDLIVIEGITLFPGPQQDSISFSDVTVASGEGNDTIQLALNSAVQLLVTDFIAADDILALETTALELAQNAYGGDIESSAERANLLAGADIILDGSLGTVTLDGAAGQTLDGDNLVLSDGSVFVYNVGGAAASFDGSANDDFMIAGDGGDTFTAGAGSDTVIGGDGNDLFAMERNFGGDVLIGGEGNDTLAMNIGDGDGYFISQDSIEQINLTWTGSAGVVYIGLTSTTGIAVDAADLTVGQDLSINTSTLTGGARIETGRGTDTLTGSNDTLQGDTLSAGDANDLIYGLLGNDILNGEEGVDTIYGNRGADTMTGGDGADVFAFIDDDTGFTLATVDHITDFNASEDKILTEFGGGTIFDQRLVDLSGSTDLADAAADIYGATSGIDTTDYIVFVYAGRTYIYSNDDFGGFETDDDYLIDVTGFTGTITDSTFDYWD